MAKDKQAELGFWLAEKYQGKGIITKACRLMINYAFEVMGLQRIEILCASKNYKSRAVPQRLNFTQEGILRHYHFLNNDFIDSVIYSMLKQDWRRI